MGEEKLKVWSDDKRKKKNQTASKKFGKLVWDLASQSSLGGSQYLIFWLMDFQQMTGWGRWKDLHSWCTAPSLSFEHKCCSMVPVSDCSVTVASRTDLQSIAFVRSWGHAKQTFEFLFPFLFGCSGGEPRRDHGQHPEILQPANLSPCKPSHLQCWHFLLPQGSQPGYHEELQFAVQGGFILYIQSQTATCPKCHVWTLFCWTTRSLGPHADFCIFWFHK